MKLCVLVGAAFVLFNQIIWSNGGAGRLHFLGNLNLLHAGSGPELHQNPINVTALESPLILPLSKARNPAESEVVRP